MIARVKTLIVDAIKANGRGEITGDILQDVLLEMLTTLGEAIDEGDADSHWHDNKSLLDTITQEMLDNALREMLGVESTEEATDENYFSALRTLKEILDNNEALKDLFLSKINDDTAEGFIQFLKGISVQELATLTQGLEVGDYTPGFLGGGGAFKMNNGISELEVDKLTVRMVATFFEILVSKIRHVGGQILLTPARMKCIKVVEEEEHYRCYFDRGENNEAEQEFIVGDQARCQVFTGSGTKFYWRLVTAVGDDWIQLDKEDCVEGSDAPEVGDDIVQLGHRLSDNIDRMSAIILSTVGSDSPSFKQYKGIQFYTLEGKEITVFSGRGNKIAGDTIFIQDKTLEDIINVQEEDIKKVEQAIEEAEKNIPKPLWNIEAVNIIPDAPAVLFREDNEGNPYTLTLVPKIWRNHEDVTEIMQGATERIFEFERHNRWGIDDKGVTDANWNLAHRGFNQVTLTHEDIMFVGTIYFVINDDILEEQYQILINK